MTAAPFLALTFLGGYLIGSIPFGWLIARWRGVDILRMGSGNIGATNVGRVLGRQWGLLVFVLDFAKGALPTLAAMKASAVGAELPAEVAGVAAGVAAFLGHLFPLFLGFRGGKGVATGAGVVAMSLPGPALASLAVWAVVVVASRTVALGSLAAGATLCLLHLLRGPEAWVWPKRAVTIFCLVVVGLVFWRHRTNLQRLARGQENRLKDTPFMFLSGKILHVMSLGLWFGSALFFTFVVAIQLFRTFERLSVEPRPIWLPVPAEFTKEPPSRRFPDPLRKEQGSRIAGAAVGPLFDWYYPLQLACGFAAAATALGWSWGRRADTLARLRARVLVTALLTVAVGWWTEREVGAMRVTRSETSDAVLIAPAPTAADLMRADEAREDFGRWHLASLMLNFLTILLVTAAMGLAASLPAMSTVETRRHD